MSKKTCNVRITLYQIGIQTASEFLDLNSLALPEYYTYQDVADGLAGHGRQVEFFRRSVKLGLQGAATGRYTGLYYDHYVFVNVPRTALPVQSPAVRSWSWPGWKTDRTAAGVVAHEVGHHVERPWGPGLTRAWREHLAAKDRSRRVSGYEPTAGEAWAETLRLFILNPDLARRALPWRCEFLDRNDIRGIARLERKGWRAVLGNKNYEAAAERWIGSR